ncbi:MAG: zinc dependent phospholipase C family protein [Oscillospiraceae bacterium]|nr:zinc dependent phospholipase C family protein [Oscillospiraceae bacterium]
MNKYSHIMIGEIVYEHLKKEHGIHLEKDSFIKGNIIPDFSYYAIVHPHFMNLSLGFVQAEIETLSKTYLKSALVGSDYSYRLGIICHYYADFFCYAHSSHYKQIIVNHLKYEHLLHEHFLKSLDLISKNDALFSCDISKSPEEINSKMLQFHAQYSRLEPSYDNDLEYTLKACTETFASLAYYSSTHAFFGSLDICGEKAAV